MTIGKSLLRMDAPAKATGRVGIVSPLLTELMGGVYLELDPRGTIDVCDSSHEMPAGYSWKSLCGKKWSDVFTLLIEGQTHWLKILDDIAKGNRRKYLTALKTETGSEGTCYLEWRFQAALDGAGNVVSILGVGQDITRWFQSEMALIKERTELVERNKELICLYGIAQSMGNPELSFRLKIEKILEFIPQAFQFSHIAAAEIELDDHRFLCPGFKCGEIVCSLSERVFVSGQQRGEVQVVYYCEEIGADDESPEFLVEERNLLRTISRQLALFVRANDADDRKAELQVQLHHADRLSKIGQLSAGIAHEMNTPLGNILGFAQLAAKAQGLPEQVSSDLERIIKSTLYAREIIKKLMLFSRQFIPRQIRIDLNTVVEESLAFIEPICIRDSLQVVRKLDPLPCNIMADPSQMNQVLMNLIMNAIHAMPGGGHVTIETRRDDANIYLVVEDTGTGMDPETIDQIFLPFFTTKEVDQGTGLGLSVVHGIIQTHGASITVSSQKGKGSKFTILFTEASDMKEG